MSGAWRERPCRALALGAQVILTGIRPEAELAIQLQCILIASAPPTPNR
jgi:hypothetical protein